MTHSPIIAQWQKYLRADPTRWLFETDDPSILLWYQLDIAHRPEDARAVMDTRERVLYSEPVQSIFAAQNEIGYWGDAVEMARPYYTATLWNLALLAELGIPRTSRRARHACEFILQNFLNADETVAGLDEIETGFLLRAFGYFNYANDVRVRRAAHALSQRVDSYAARVGALWGWRAFCQDAEITRAAQETLERVLDDLDRNAAASGGNAAASGGNAAASGGNAAASVPYTFPQFDARDKLFLLRVLAEYERVQDERVAPLIDALVTKQNKGAQWTLERDLNAQLVTPLEKQGAPSRWITLNALRVIVKRVQADG
jgi:hypothetical protein